MASDWQPAETAPEGVVVETKIDDSNGVRNEQKLKRRARIWFVPDGSTYVYYTPTHWRPTPPEPSVETALAEQLRSEIVAMIHYGIPLGTSSSRADRLRRIAGDIDDRDATIAEQAARIGKLERVIEIQRHALDRYRPCPDHNGKVNAAREWECQWCRAERAEGKFERLEAQLSEARE